MSELTLNLSDYKWSGVYFIEIDNTQTEATRQTAARLAVGFNNRAPFNRPVYLSGTDDCDAFLGDIDRKLERKGCFMNRNVRTMVSKAPVYAMNLLPVNTTDSSANKDVVGFSALSANTVKPNIDGKTIFAGMYDRSRFWIADDNALVSSVASELLSQYHGTYDSKAATNLLHSPLFSVGNCGTSDISLIVRKAEGISGYSVTFLDWYGSEEQIPFKWINPYDYVSDYFVQVIAVKGNWDSAQYASYATDPVWKEYFTAEGLRKEKLNKFIRSGALGIVGNWTGCVIPDFYDKKGNNVSISYQINKVCNKTGLLFGTNHEALDELTYGKVSINGTVTSTYYLTSDVKSEEDGVVTLNDTASVAPYKVDLTGNSVSIDASGNYPAIDFLSYAMTSDEVSASGVVKANVKAFYNSAEPNKVVILKKDLGDISFGIGDFVRCTDGRIYKVVKRSYKQADAATSSADVVDASTGLGYTYYEYTILGQANISTGDQLLSYSVLNLAGDESASETADNYENYLVTADGATVLGSAATIKINGVDGYASGAIEIHKQISDVYEYLKFIPLQGMKLSNRHMPGYDSDGNVDLEAGVSKIYAMLQDPGIRAGLLNTEMVDYRYIVDTMAYGLGESCKAKSYITELAHDRTHCLALCNLPSMSQFAASTAPFFGDTYEPDLGEAKPTFNVKYIPDGGNQDMDVLNVEFFTLPDESKGSTFSAFFAPFLKYAEGTNTILVPPAADVSNTFMNKLTGGDPYKVVANLNGIIANTKVTGVEYDFSDDDRGYLEHFGVNPIVSRNGRIVIYGDRTAYQDVISDLNYLHTRETLNTLEINCKAILDDYVFTYNVAKTRAEITQRIAPILQAAIDSSAILKYEIQVDDVNNTIEVINANTGIVDIGIWVSNVTEKIITRITLNKSAEA